MPTVYVYIDGSDLDEVEVELVFAFSSLAKKWSNLEATLVNYRVDNASNLDVGDLPDWFIGINVPIKNFTKNQASELVPFLVSLARSTGRDFVFGIATDCGISEDVIFIDAKSGEDEKEALVQYVAAL